MEVASFGPRQTRKLTPFQWVRWRSRRLLSPLSLLNAPAVFATAAGVYGLSHPTPHNLIIGALFLLTGVWCFLDSMFHMRVAALDDDIAPLVLEAKAKDFTPVRLRLTRRFFDRVEDVGIVWFDRGTLRYVGHRTRFRLASPSATDIVKSQAQCDILDDSWKSLVVWVEGRWIDVDLFTGAVAFPKPFLRRYKRWHASRRPHHKTVLPPSEFEPEEEAPWTDKLPRWPLAAESSVLVVIGMALLLKGKAEALLFLPLPLIMRGAFQLGVYLGTRFDRDVLDMPDHVAELHAYLRENPHVLDEKEFGNPPASTLSSS